MWFGACSSGGPTKTTSRSGDTMHCHAAAQQTLVILSPTLPKLCDMNSHFICLSLCHFSCIYQRGSSSTAFSTSARQRLARMSRGVHFSTWSQQAHGSLQPTVQNCISRFITHMRWHHPCFRRALSLCRATLLVGCVGSRRQANQRWLPLASPVPTKPIKENDIKKPKHAYPWEDQCTHLAAVWVRSCTIVSQDAAVFCLNFLLYEYCRCLVTEKGRPRYMGIHPLRYSLDLPRSRCVGSLRIP